MKKNLLLVSFGLFFVCVLYYVDLVLQVAYAYKVLFKLGLMLLSLLLAKWQGWSLSFLGFKSLGHYKKGLFFSLGAFVAILLAYFFLSPYLDVGVMAQEFSSKYRLSGASFIWASLYLVFVNSFLEEYFFRGFLFFNLDNRLFAHLFSAGLFSLYHLSNIRNWFSHDLLFLLPLAGLLASGLFFNYLNEKNRDIYASYFPHLFADLAIVIIGLILLY